ncbi:MAG: DNA-deoxyinosine glycosylase, partial [Fibromonadales bacterium]|nr:DNA-deoxyinosine glycosylase [Fibromonadales bacterium]
GHPQNRFWKTIAELFNEPMPASDSESKRNFILSHNLALWDVLHSCEITGADDSTIRNPVPNKFQPILAKSKIRAIFTNGKKATELFQKLCAEEAGMDAVYLPSTSPANRAWHGRAGFMREWGKVLLFLCFMLIVPIYSQELICAPNFEVIELNADVGKSSIETLQSKMDRQSDMRQLIVPSATDHVAVTNNINHQISWAKNRGCLYLLQTRLIRFEKNIQVNAQVMNLNSGDYVFENVYRVPQNDLPLVFERLGNALQHPEFIQIEIAENASIENPENLASRKSLTGLGFSMGYLYLSNLEHTYDARYVYLWDKESIWLEAILSLKINFKEHNSFSHIDNGFRVLYPFSNELKTFYIGAGGGFSWGNGMFVENSLGYLTWRNNMPFRIEATSTALFHDKKSIGGGLRIVTGLSALFNDSLRKAQIKAKEEKAKEKKTERKFKYRFVYGDYYVRLPGYSGTESGTILSAGIATSIPISKNTTFEPGFGLAGRSVTVIRNDRWNGKDRVSEGALSIPAMFKIMPFGGPRFYVEGGGQLDIPFGTSFGYNEKYDSRAAFDLGLALGLGWHIGKRFSFGVRGINGLTNFDKTADSRPIQFEWGITL